MATCKYKDPETGWCKLHSDWSEPMAYIEYCVDAPCPDETLQTNSDRIRAMNDEELAHELTRNPYFPCRMCEHHDEKLEICRAWTSDFVCVAEYAKALTVDWLKQEVPQ